MQHFISIQYNTNGSYGLWRTYKVCKLIRKKFTAKFSSQQNELVMEQYIRSLYLTDFSNMLLALHSATNWLIFYRWPRVVSTV